MDKIRFGIVGCGSIGPTHAGAIRQIEGTEIVAVADVVKTRADGMAQKFGVAKVYESDAALCP